MNQTYEEQERSAYLAGDVEKAELLRKLVAAERLIDELQERIDGLEKDLGL